MCVKLGFQTQNVGAVECGGFVRLAQLGDGGLDLVFARGEHHLSWK